MSTTICGVDPGLNGAIAFLNIEAGTIEIVDMPTVERGGKRHVDPFSVGAIFNKHTPDHVFLELVHSSPQMGVASAFSFGRSSGIILGSVASIGATIKEVPPSVWKPRMGCTSDKTQTTEQATKLMPACAPAWKLKKHVDRAEAALIAVYGAVIEGHTVGDLKLKP